MSAWRDLSSDDQQSYHEAAAGLSIPSGYNLFLAEQLGGGSSGGVVVSQTLSATFYPDGSQDSERIPIGGQYGLNNFHYAFDVLASGTVLITVDGDADPIIWLDDGSGNQIASDDDGGSSLDSRLELLLEPGTYTLEVGVYWDRGIDETTLVLEGNGVG